MTTTKNKTDIFPISDHLLLKIQHSFFQGQTRGGACLLGLTNWVYEDTHKPLTYREHRLYEFLVRSI